MCHMSTHFMKYVVVAMCVRALKITNKPFSSLQLLGHQKLKHMISEIAITKFQKFQGGQRGLSHPPKLVVSYNRAPRKKNCRIFTLMDFKAALGLISSRGLLVICSKYARETHQPFGASSAIDHFSTVRWLGLCPTTYVKWFDYYLHHYSPWNHLRRNQLPN